MLNVRSLRERVIRVANFDHEGVDDPCHPNLRPRAPLGQGVVCRLVAIGCRAVDADKDMNGPICVLEPFRCPYVLTPAMPLGTWVTVVQSFRFELEAMAKLVWEPQQLMVGGVVKAT